MTIDSIECILIGILIFHAIICEIKIEGKWN